MKTLVMFALLSASIFAARSADSKVEVLVTLTSGDLIRVHQVSPGGVIPRVLFYKSGEAHLREDTHGGWVAGTTMGPGEDFRIKFSDGKTRSFQGVDAYNRPTWVGGSR